MYGTIFDVRRVFAVNILICENRKEKRFEILDK